MAQKASQADVAMSITSKANVSDVSKVIAEMQANMEEKHTSADMSRLLEERVTK